MPRSPARTSGSSVDSATLDGRLVDREAEETNRGLEVTVDTGGGEGRLVVWAR